MKDAATKIPMPADFECPINMVEHLEKVFAGEYDIPLNIQVGTFKIIDLGANCGAFSIWAARRWPGSQIFAYEPVPETFGYLTRNIMRNGDCHVNATQAAVYGLENSTVLMRLGKNNCGEASLFPMGRLASTDFLEVPTLAPVNLPEADIIKLDIEGSELDVLFQLITVERRRYTAILLEYHSEAIRRALDTILCDYCLLKADIAEPERGTLCYVEKRFIG